MNFGKLLATGKSMINGRRSPAYRANKKVYLPKFESPKNPFAKAAPAAGVADAAASAPAPEPVKRSGPAARPAGSANWTGRLNPMAIFRGAGSPPVRAFREEQAELSLDTVKVVSNDLSDTHVEVVPLKSRVARVTEPVESWSDLGAKVFEVNAV